MAVSDKSSNSKGSKPKETGRLHSRSVNVVKKINNTDIKKQEKESSLTSITDASEPEVLSENPSATIVEDYETCTIHEENEVIDELKDEDEKEEEDNTIETNPNEEKTTPSPSTVEENQPHLTIAKEDNHHAEETNANAVQEIEELPGKPNVVELEITPKRVEIIRGKKETTAVSNDVIEETAKQLREQKKNRVRALAGAFETVISLSMSG